MLSIPPVRYILPNLFTLAATFCGFAVLVVAHQATVAQDFYLATCFIPLACFLDGFDGRIARLVGGESRFGVQLDSLSDFATFGVAPAFLVYTWALEPLGAVGLLAAFSFTAAAMVRLARFNVAAEDDGGKARFFTGLPSPMGGGAIAALISLETGFLQREAALDAGRPATAVFVVLIALLMVSNVPFRTFKDVRMTPFNRTLIGSTLASIVIVGWAYDFMFALSLGLFGYILSGVIGSVFTLRRRVVVPGAGTILSVFHDEDEDDDDDDDTLV
jgi:CDP-diacylglycerol--serine O-phosphatidyltransferase